jgi:hypothetical protein
MGLLGRHRSVLDALGNDEDFARPELNDSVSKLDIDSAAQNQKEVIRVLVLVLVPHELALDFCDHEIVSIEIADDARLPVVFEFAELVGQVYGLYLYRASLRCVGSARERIMIAPLDCMRATNLSGLERLFGNKGSGMKTLLRTMFVGAVLSLAGVALAAEAPDPVVGTWNLNLAKSKFDPSQALKSQTRTYTQGDDGISVTVNGVRADGSALSQRSTFKYDGKAYPWSGAADYDALTLKRVNGSTVTAVLMKADKKAGTTTRTISGHGKVMTLSTKVKGADGKSHSTVLVLDKQ